MFLHDEHLPHCGCVKLEHKLKKKTLLKSFSRNATRAGSEEGRLFLQATPAMQVNFKLMVLYLWLEHLTGEGKVMDFTTIGVFLLTLVFFVFF